MSTAYVSPSQIKQASRCGWQHEFKRVMKLTPPKLGPYLLSGSVVHAGREKWALDHSLDFVDLIRKAWRTLGGDSSPGLLQVVSRYEQLSTRRRNLLAEIQERRPDIVAPDRTADYKNHPLAKEVARFERDVAPLLAHDTYDWEKGFAAIYDRTINIAAAYQEHYRDAPESLITERKYQLLLDTPAGTITLTGVIDDISVLISPEGELVAYGIFDAKTYTKEPHPLKDFLQLASYTKVAQQQLPDWLELADLPYNPELPILAGLDLMSLLTRQFFRYSESSLQVALDIAYQYQAWRDAAHFLPSFYDCDGCEWAEECMHRTGMEQLELEVL